MRYSQIRTMDISDGPGVRVGLYTQGCPFHCEGCWNSNTWDFDGGRVYNEETKNKLLECMSRDYVCGLSILGGEPLIDSNIDELYILVSEIKRLYPNKTIWIWTGFLFEYLNRSQKKLLRLCDVLVDGRFEEDKKNLNLEYRGSSNQRVIDLKRSFKENKIVEWSSR